MKYIVLALTMLFLPSVSQAGPVRDNYKKRLQSNNVVKHSIHNKKANRHRYANRHNRYARHNRRHYHSHYNYFPTYRYYKNGFYSSYSYTEPTFHIAFSL